MHKNRYLAGISIACTAVGTAAGISGVAAACMWDASSALSQLMACVVLMWLAIDAAAGMRRVKEAGKEEAE